MKINMKKLVLFLAIFMVIATMTASIAFAFDKQADKSVDPNSPAAAEKPVLTDEQKNEIKGIMSQMQELRKQLIDKYAGFGIITQEQADKMKEKIDSMTKIAEEKGYLPKAGFGRKMNGEGKGPKCGVKGTCKKAPAASPDNKDSN